MLAVLLFAMHGGRWRMHSVAELLPGRWQRCTSALWNVMRYRATKIMVAHQMTTVKEGRTRVYADRSWTCMHQVLLHLEKRGN